jgi:DNA-binding transcriptional ArsR family regulator
MLRLREATPAELNETLNIKGGVLTFHLRVLATAGVITQRRRGRNRSYRLHAQVLAPIWQWVRPYEARA